MRIGRQAERLLLREWLAPLPPLASFPMTEPARRFRLQRLDKRPESFEELTDGIAEILADGFYSYLLRKGLLKQQNTQDIVARIEELRKSRPNYDAL